MSLNAAAVEQTDGVNTAGAVWAETRAVWTDGVAQDFEDRFWNPLEAQTRDAVGAIDRLATLLAKAAQGDCT